MPKISIADLKAAKARHEFKKAGGVIQKCKPARADGCSHMNFTFGRALHGGSGPARHARAVARGQFDGYLDSPFRSSLHNNKGLPDSEPPESD